MCSIINTVLVCVFELRLRIWDLQNTKLNNNKQRKGLKKKQNHMNYFKMNRGKTGRLYTNK
jgi:hypothetical protein